MPPEIIINADISDDILSVFYASSTVKKLIQAGLSLMRLMKSFILNKPIDASQFVNFPNSKVIFWFLLCCLYRSDT